MIELILEHGLPLAMILPLLSAAVIFAVNNRSCSFLISMSTAIATNSIMMILFAKVLFFGNGATSLRYNFGGWNSLLGIEFIWTPLNGLMALIVHIAYLYTCAFTYENWNDKKQDATVFYTLLNVFIIGMTGMSLSNDAFNVFVFMEIASITGYAMVALGSDVKSPVAAFNYLIIGSIGASLYLLGVGIIYLDTGVLNISLLRIADKHSNITILSGLFIMTGLAIKSALFPLHVWLARAYRFAPASFSMCSSAISTKVFMLVMIKLWAQIFTGNIMSGALLILSICSMVFGALMAYIAKDIRYVLAYSSVSQVGYILSGFILKAPKALEASIVNILSHSFIQLSMFSVVAMATAISTKKDLDLGTISKQSKLCVICAMILLASIVGVPGTAGFLSKWLLVQAVIIKKQWFVLASIVISSVFAVGYCLKIAQQLLKPNAEQSLRNPRIGVGVFIISSSTIIIVMLGVSTGSMHAISMIIYRNMALHLT